MLQRLFLSVKPVSRNCYAHTEYHVKALKAVFIGESKCDRALSPLRASFRLEKEIDTLKK